ncbi:MAG TPA: cyclic-di-AMP receptor [bacterium]|nr:cyclic-di-AMP receptor [bacterium]
MGDGRSSAGNGKKLLLIIASHEDASQVLDTFAHSDIPATRFGSTGGIWQVGSVSILSGVNADQVDRVIEVMQQICEAHQGRRRAPTSAQEHRMVVFVLDATRMERV